MKKEKEDVIAYKNVGRRVLILREQGLLEEIKLENLENLHGRKDYKVTMKGFETLVFYALMHPEEVENIINYMFNFGLNQKEFGDALLKSLLVIAETISEYQKAAKIPYDRHEVAKLLNQFYDIINESGSEISKEMLNRDVKEILGIVDKQKKRYKK